MQPALDLTEASVNLQNFRKLSKTRDFPDFRKKALTEKFILHLSYVCRILKAFPNPDKKTLDEEYDIKHILEILFEIESWDQIPPFKFYFEPFMKAYDELVAELRKMWKDGHLHMSYYVESNLVMSQKIYELVHQYNIVKVLAGDELKRDQFKFIYKVHDQIFKSALKDIYLDTKLNASVMANVIPEMTVFKTMLHIRDVDDKKALDLEKKKKKAAEREALGLSEEEEEELKLELPPQPVTKKGKKKVEIDPEVIEQAKVAALFKKELATYGRTWIWELYYKEDDARKEAWLAGADALRRINDQVLDDIEYYIQLKGFIQNGQQLQVEAITARIQKDLHQRREREAMEQATVQRDAEDEKEDDPLEKGMIEDKKRKFMTQYRPHERVWNFIEEDPSTRLPHLLRATADPSKAYIDGRVENLLTIIEGMGAHLRSHQEEQWVHLNKMTLEIFRHYEDDAVKKMEVYKKTLEEQAAK